MHYSSRHMLSRVKVGIAALVKECPVALRSDAHVSLWPLLNQQSGAYIFGLQISWFEEHEELTVVCDAPLKSLPWLSESGSRLSYSSS